MKPFPFIIVLILTAIATSCHHNPAPATLTPQQAINIKIDSIKTLAAPGDLITRLNDDILSEMIKELAGQDKSFSHSGVIFLQGNTKMVCHIFPEPYPADTVIFEPLDSFINPAKNLTAGLFRYNFSQGEKEKFLAQLQAYQTAKIHFDKQYNLQTDTAMYCTEMIAKALQLATNNRLACKTIHMPERLIPILVNYFKEYNFTAGYIKNTPFLPIESLYLLPGCKELIRTRLKYMP